MDTTITMEQLGEALDIPVVLVSAICSKSKRSKKLTFTPSELRYKIILTEGFGLKCVVENNPHDALEAYNAIIL